VKDWILNMSKCGFPLNKQELLDTVQKIVKEHGTKNPFKDDRPGQTWYVNFLKRHPDLACLATEDFKKGQPTEESIRIWFSELESFLREGNNKNILECPERIFNADERRFTVCSVTGEITPYLSQVKSDETDNITILVSFNAKAQMSPPLVVFPHVRPMSTVVDNTPDGWCLGKSEHGWMRSDVFCEYITNDFNNWVDSNCIRKPILLLIDGYSSHMSPFLSGMCEKLDIILYALPPNTTHILHPSDVSVFGPLKSSWKDIVRNLLSKPENVTPSVNKTNFCQLFRDIL
jgi:hypothetical protein